MQDQARVVIIGAGIAGTRAHPVSAAPCRPSPRPEECPFLHADRLDQSGAGTGAVLAASGGLDADGRRHSHAAGPGGAAPAEAAMAHGLRRYGPAGLDSGRQPAQ